MPLRVIQSPSLTTWPLLVLKRLAVVGDLDLGAADDAALAPAAGDERRVRGHAALAGEDGLRLVHAVDVFGRGLFADEDDLLALLGPLHGVFAGEDRAALRAAGTGGQALGDRLGGAFGLGIEHRQQELDELVRRNAHDGGLGVDELFLVHVDGHVHGSGAVALADAALEHEELALLDGELDVLHVLVVLLERPWISKSCL